ncbi:26847_t:CDS:2 [Dentiscutata erythropus]|uniref:26847_t:CDS:1 n=1 Tax=Dentiscutata erythropus TaxID=1348616 RepID=A0A9N8Z932_9GLOM|nr:26847_t:CDS:2 [Dentiscutata erythropus]
MVNNEELTKEQQIKAKEFFLTEEDLFALSIENMGCTNVTTHRINTEDTILIKQTYYRATYEENEFIRKEINKLKKQGLIFEINKEHLEHLKIIFEKLRKAELKLNPEKCTFFKSEINYLRHVINKEGVRPDESKVEKVKNFSIPVNIRQLRGFIGLASYYCRFIRGFASIARPIHKLLEKNVPYRWKEEQQNAFVTLKRHLIMAPILRYPNFKEEFFLYTDASGMRLEAILAQKDKDYKKYVVAYAS